MPDPPLVTTTLLLERLRDRNDQDAWRQLDERFRGVLVATARRLGLSQPDAEETTQQTMLEAFRDYQRGKYDRSRGRLSSWIISIAHHRIVDVQRRKRAAGGVSEAGEVREPEVVDAFERSLERRIFEDAWEMVKDQGKSSSSTLRAFELTAMRNVPAEEAARQCGMSVDQVYVARNRVARRLQEAVEKIDRAVRDGL